jgi:hypothetical protein
MLTTLQARQKANQISIFWFACSSISGQGNYKKKIIVVIPGVMSALPHMDRGLNLE